MRARTEENPARATESASFLERHDVRAHGASARGPRRRGRVPESGAGRRDIIDERHAKPAKRAALSDERSSDVRRTGHAIELNLRTAGAYPMQRRPQRDTGANGDGAGEQGRLVVPTRIRSRPMERHRDDRIDRHAPRQIASKLE